MVATARFGDVRSQNRKLVLSMLRRCGTASRTDIGISTGLSGATVSAITSDFIAEGTLVHPEASNVLKHGRGRPKVALELNADAAMICAVYFHMNQISASIVDYSGKTIGEFSVQLATLDAKLHDLRKTLVNCVDQALTISKRNRSALCRISVAFQGVTDVNGSLVLWTPITKHLDIPVRAWLENHFGVPSRVANDCDMIAQALNWREPEKYGKNFAAVLLAHGVGMGLYLREGIINGTTSSGIEFGHMTYIPDGDCCRCGSQGCIEAYAGDYAISRRAQGQQGSAPPIDPHDSPDLDRIAAAASRGDADAIAAIEAAGAAIGTGLSNLYTIVDPFPIVLVGRGAILFEQMEQSLRAKLHNTPWKYATQDIEIDCYTDEVLLVQEGCTINALLVQDEEMSNRRNQVEAAQ